MIIDRDLPVPPWRQLALILRAKIESGEITVRLPGERTLMQEYGVAQGTVRKAITWLQNEGLVETVHGMGSYIRKPE